MRHPGIIKLFASFDSGDKLFFSLELLNDGNLLDYINSNPYLDARESGH